MQEQIELVQTDWKKWFLTTYASNVAVGAILSQEGRPIKYILKTLSSTKQIYATNEKELFAIVRALKTLRHCLYTAKDMEIHTDYKPLAFAMSEKTINVKMKRWRALIEVFVNNL